jgi:hypothetical protein
MPRVTLKDQYNRYKFLRKLWCNRDLRIFYLLLSYKAQQELTDFYQPNEELTEEQFYSHLANIDKEPSDIFHTAGKYFKYLEQEYLAITEFCNNDQDMIKQVVFSRIIQRRDIKSAAISANRTKKGQSAMSGTYILPTYKSEIDIDKLGDTFIKLVRHLYNIRIKN